MNDKFTLDPEYKNFVPGRSALKQSTLGLRGCLLVLYKGGALMYIVTLVFLHALNNSLVYEMGLFRTQSAETTGQVLNCEMINVKSYSSIPRLDYSYSWDGVAFEGSQVIYERDQDCAPYLNQVVDVRVVTTHPDMSRLMMRETPDSYTSNATKNTPLTLLTVLLGGMTVASLIPLVFHQRGKRKYARLVSGESQLLTGEITKVSGQTASKSTNYIVSVRYQFQSPTGETLKGHISHHRQDLKGNLPSVGTPVDVLYADDRAYVML